MLRFPPACLPRPRFGTSGTATRWRSRLRGLSPSADMLHKRHGARGGRGPHPARDTTSAQTWRYRDCGRCGTLFLLLEVSHSDQITGRDADRTLIDYGLTTRTGRRRFDDGRPAGRASADFPDAARTMRTIRHPVGNGSHAADGDGSMIADRLLRDFASRRYEVYG